MALPLFFGFMIGQQPFFYICQNIPAIGKTYPKYKKVFHHQQGTTKRNPCFVFAVAVVNCGVFLFASIH
jgi:hypothetical protein